MYYAPDNPSKTFDYSHVSHKFFILKFELKYASLCMPT